MFLLAHRAKTPFQCTGCHRNNGHNHIALVARFGDVEVLIVYLASSLAFELPKQEPPKNFHSASVKSLFTSGADNDALLD